MVLIVGLLPLGLTVQGDMLYLLGLTAPLAAATILVYARLLGRLGAMIRARIPFLPEDRPVRKSPKKGQKLPPVRPTPDPNTPFVGEPDHVYDEATKKRALLFEEDGDIMQAYTLNQSTSAAVPEPETPPPTRTRPLDEEEVDARLGYEIDTPITPDAPATPVKKPKLRKKKPPPPPGLNTLFRGVFTFPCYPTSMGHGSLCPLELPCFADYCSPAEPGSTGIVIGCSQYLWGLPPRAPRPWPGSVLRPRNLVEAQRHGNRARRAVIESL